MVITHHHSDLMGNPAFLSVLEPKYVLCLDYFYNFLQYTGFNRITDSDEAILVDKFFLNFMSATRICRYFEVYAEKVCGGVFWNDFYVEDNAEPLWWITDGYSDGQVNQVDINKNTTYYCLLETPFDDMFQSTIRACTNAGAETITFVFTFQKGEGDVFLFTKAQISEFLDDVIEAFANGEPMPENPYGVNVE